MSYTRSVAQGAASSVASIYMRQVYQWMTAGLGVTTVVAYAVASSPAVQEAIFGNTIVLVLMLVAQFGLVIALSAAVHKMSGGTATGLFLLYSAVTGATLSSIFVVYPIASIANAFLVTTGTFLAMIRIDDLGDDWYDFDPHTMSLVGQRSGVMWRMGQSLEVALAEVNLGRLEIRLMPLELPKAAQGGAGRGRGKPTRRPARKGGAKPGSASRPGGSRSGWKVTSPGDEPGKRGSKAAGGGKSSRRSGGKNSGGNSSGGGKSGRGKDKTSKKRGR